MRKSIIVSRRLALFLVCAFMGVAQAMADDVATIGTTGYATLSAALSAATSGQTITITATTCTLDADATLQSGVTLDVPSGKTLLIPFDVSGTCYTTNPDAVYLSSYSAPSAYRTLTMKTNSVMKVEGNVSVSAKMISASGSQPAAGGVYDKYGHIKMEEGSIITLTGSANLYAWGYISGDGKVIAQAGTTVYEGFQINDFQGGSAISSMGNKVFPFSQYYVQNIEASLTLECGAQEKVLSNLYVGLFRKSPTSTGLIDFVGTTSGLFQLESGSKLTKRYNADKDKMEYTLEGNAFLSSISFNFSTSIFGMKTVNSSSYVLPITNNMDITVKGGKLTVNQDIEILPGVQVEIEEDAEVNVASWKNCYIYDKEEWQQYAMNNAVINPISYTVANGTTTKRTAGGLEDTKITVKGTLSADGSLYTTSSGANICCEGGAGKVVMNTIPKDGETTHQYKRNGTSVTDDEVTVNSAWLNTGETDAEGNPVYVKTGESGNGTGTYSCVKTENGTTTWTKTPESVTLYTLTLDQTSVTAPESQNGAVNVSYARQFNQGWNSLVLPMAVTATELGEKGITSAVEYNGSESDGNMVTLKFTVVTELEANKPYMVYFGTAPSSSENTFNTKSVHPEVTITTEDANTTFDFVGTYVSYAHNGTGNPIKNGDYIVTSTGLKRTVGGNPLNAFRAFFQAKTVEAQEAKVGFNIDGGGLTAIQAIELEGAILGDNHTDGMLYNLSGQRVNGSYKGIVVKNGKKVLVK